MPASISLASLFLTYLGLVAVILAAILGRYLSTRAAVVSCCVMAL